MNKIIPFNDRVIIRPDEAEEITEGGMIVPEIAQKKPPRGIVVLAGKGKADDPVHLKEGDHVRYGKRAGTEIQIAGESLLIMREGDVKVVINKKAGVETPAVI